MRIVIFVIGIAVAVVYPMGRSQAAELQDSLDCGRQATIYTKAGQEFSGRLCCGVDSGIGLWTKEDGLSVFTYDELQSVQLCGNRAGKGAIWGFLVGFAMGSIYEASNPIEPDSSGKGPIFESRNYLPHIALVAGCTIFGAIIGSRIQTCKTIDSFMAMDICSFEQSESTAPGATLSLEFRIVLAKF